MTDPRLFRRTAKRSLARCGFCLLTAGALFVGCSSRAEDPDASVTALADTLATLIEEAYDFGSPEPLARMNDLYASGAQVVSASGGDIIVSADSVRAGIARFWESAGQNMRSARWHWEEVHVERLAQDAAVLTGRWSLPHVAPDGMEHTIEGAWTAVFQRIEGEWKIVHEHLSQPSI